MKPQDGARRIRELSAELADGARILDPYLDALRTQAQSTAGRHPSPQARMAASALIVRDSSLQVPSAAIVSGRGGSTSAGSIAGGSEYGSSIYPQFGPRGGSRWLGTSAEHPSSTTLQAGERALDELVRDTCG